MDILEVILLIVGIVIFIGSFLLPAGRSDAGRIDTDAAKQEIHGLIEEEMKTVRAQVQDKVEETSEDVVEKAERSLERLTNEKIMAVNEYSDTVLQEIHKNHEEAMFLYDMLNNKHANIKDTVSKVDKAVKAAEDKVKAIDDTPAVKTEETEKVIPADEPAKTEEAVSPEIGFMGETSYSYSESAGIYLRGLPIVWILLSRLRRNQSGKCTACRTSSVSNLVSSTGNLYRCYLWRFYADTDSCQITYRWDQRMEVP